MKYVVVPDSFKGTVSSVEACRIIKERILKNDPEADVIAIPVADGGEGSVEAFLEISGGRRVETYTTGPFAESTVKAYYGLIDGGKTAVIEMAACAGLPLAGSKKNPEITTTYGVGCLINDAVGKGAKKIILCLGGSATNDGGCGAAAACGIKFYGEDGKTFIPTGGTLHNIRKIDASEAFYPRQDVEFVTMCDVKNVMYGEKGASSVFGPQKGADEEAVQRLDNGIKHLCEIIKRDLGKDIDFEAGSGAAGGMGGGSVAFFGSHLKSGIETVLEQAGFEEKIKGASWIFTGEGRFDGQSMQGKVINGVAEKASLRNVPVIVIAGSVCDTETRDVYEKGVTAVFSINRQAMDFEKSAPLSCENLSYTVDNIMKIIKRNG